MFSLYEGEVDAALGGKEVKTIVKKEGDGTGSSERIDGENRGTAMRSLACGTQSIKGTTRK